jgi:signal transduction histidine kinase
LNTSITNKIIVIFIILMLMYSIVLIGFLFLAITDYNKELVEIIESAAIKLPQEYSPYDVNNNIILSMIVVCLLLIIASFILGRYLVSKINKPLDYLIQQIGDVNVSQIDKSQLHFKIDDEIGMLIDSYNSMKVRLSISMNQLEVQNKRLEATLNNMPSSVAIIDEDYIVEMMNENGGCFFNYHTGLNDKSGKCYELFAQRDRPCEKCPLKPDNPFSEIQIFFKERVFVLASYAIQYSEEIRVSLVVSRDITDQFLMNRRMLEVEKLAQIGKVTAAITHEIKNPIAAVKSGVYYLKKLKEDEVPEYIFNKEFNETIELIEESIMHSEKVAYNLLRFSKGRDLFSLSSSIEFDKILDQILMLYSNDIMKKRIKIIRSVKIDYLVTGLDIEIFKSILLNLISNSMDEMNNGGVLTITAELETNNDYLIKISDTGSGIKEENMNKIFDPFFSTKGNDNSGLGLWIVQNEIKKVNGKIYAYNNLDSGVTFVIVLPKYRPASCCQ